MRVRPRVVKSGKELKAAYKDLYFFTKNLLSVVGYTANAKDKAAFDKAGELFDQD